MAGKLLKLSLNVLSVLNILTSSSASKLTDLTDSQFYITVGGM